MAGLLVAMSLLLVWGPMKQWLEVASGLLALLQLVNLAGLPYYFLHSSG
jgi:hypothetical protein